jgi:hypothetical protein
MSGRLIKLAGATLALLMCLAVATTAGAFTNTNATAGFIAGEENASFGTFFDYEPMMGAIPEGVPANTLIGSYFAVYVQQNGVHGPSGGTVSKAEGGAAGGAVGAFVPWGLWFYPWQPSDPHWRFANNFFMPTVATNSPVSGPQLLWFNIPAALIYANSSDISWLNFSVYSAPYLGVPVGGAFGWTTNNDIGFTGWQFTWYELADFDLKDMGWLSGLEWSPQVSITHQINSLNIVTPFSGASPASYLPGDAFVWDNEIDIPIGKLFRVGADINWGTTTSAPTIGGSAVKNAGISMVSVGPLIQYSNGPFTVIAEMARDVHDVNTTAHNVFFIYAWYAYL